MENKLKWLGVIAFIAIIVFSMSSCDDFLGDNEAQFTMSGTKMGNEYWYRISNKSKYEIQVTINSVTKTIQAGNSVTFSNVYTQSASVKYSPADKVTTRSITSGLAEFVNK